MIPLERQAADRRVRGEAEAAIHGYTAARLRRLDDLIADPASWQHIAAQALRVRAGHHHGTPQWSLLTRLHHVASDLASLGDTEQHAAS